jgi:hypothetical protein
MNQDIKNKLKRIDSLYGYAIRQGHVGRRTISAEFDITRAQAEWVLDQIRNPENHLFIHKVERYTYDEDRDEYTFHGQDFFDAEISCPISGEKIRQMKIDYTDNQYTIEEVAKKYDIDRTVFVQLKTLMGWTHHSPPVTDEEIEREDISELAEKVVMQRKKLQIEREISRLEKRELEKDALKYREIGDVIEKVAANINRKSYKVPKAHIELAPKDGVAVVNLQDVHVGKLPITGPASTDDYISDILFRVDEGLETLGRSMKIRKVYVAVGGDIVHVDTLSNTTTKGTRQDVQMGVADALTAAQDFAVRVIDVCRKYAPEVEAVYVRGNHDNVLSLAVFRFVQAWFRDTKEVIIEGSYDDREYRVDGGHLMVFTHGEMNKSNMSNIGQIVNMEARSLISSSKDTVVFTGHLHHFARSIDDGGIRHIRCSSPSPTDGYHSTMGYISRREITLVGLLDFLSDDIIMNMGL